MRRFPVFAVWVGFAVMLVLLLSASACSSTSSPVSPSGAAVADTSAKPSTVGAQMKFQAFEIGTTNWVVGATFTVTDSNGSVNYVSDNRGRFSASVAGSSATVTASVPGFCPFSRTYTASSQWQPVPLVVCQ